MEEVSPLLSLPVDALAEIFSHVDPKSRFASFALTSKPARSLAKSLPLYSFQLKDLPLKYSTLPGKSTFYLEWDHSLVDFLKTNFEETEKWLDSFVSFPREIFRSVRTLSIKNFIPYTADTLPFDVLRSILKYFPSLESLEMGDLKGSILQSYRDPTSVMGYSATINHKLVKNEADLAMHRAALPKLKHLTFAVSETALESPIFDFSNLKTLRVEAERFYIIKTQNTNNFAREIEKAQSLEELSLNFALPKDFKLPPSVKRFSYKVYHGDLAQHTEFLENVESDLSKITDLTLLHNSYSVHSFPSLHRFSGVVRLEIIKASENMDSALDFTTLTRFSLPNLKFLKIEYSNSKPNLDFIEDISSIQEFTFRAKAAYQQPFVDKVSKMTKLKSLTVLGNVDLFPLRSILAHINPDLKALDLQREDARFGVSPEELIKALPKPATKRLTSLSIQGYNFDFNTIKEISFLGNLRNLTLALGKSHVSDTWFAPILRLKFLKRLALIGDNSDGALTLVSLKGLIEKLPLEALRAEKVFDEGAKNWAKENFWPNPANRSQPSTLRVSDSLFD